MTKKLEAFASSDSRAQARAHADPVRAADQARAALLGWNQLLVARGNRLLELAVRERAALAGRKFAVEDSRTFSHRDPRVLDHDGVR